MVDVDRWAKPLTDPSDDQAGLKVNILTVRENLEFRVSPVFVRSYSNDIIHRLRITMVMGYSIFWNVAL